MKVNLRIEEDELLRKEITQIIRNAISQETAEQLRQIVLETATDDAKKLFTQSRLNTLINSEIGKRMDNVTNDGLFDTEHKKLRLLLRVEIKAVIHEQSDFIRDQIKEQVRSYMEDLIVKEIEESINRKIKEHLATMLGTTVKK